MKVFIAGATGVFEQRLVDQLTDRDNEVIGLALDEMGERIVAHHTVVVPDRDVTTLTAPNHLAAEDLLEVRVGDEITPAASTRLSWSLICCYRSNVSLVTPRVLTICSSTIISNLESMTIEDGRSRLLAACQGCGAVYAATTLSNKGLQPIGSSNGCGSCNGTEFAPLQSRMERSESAEADAGS